MLACFKTVFSIIFHKAITVIIWTFLLQLCIHIWSKMITNGYAFHRSHCQGSVTFMHSRSNLLIKQQHLHSRKGIDSCNIACVSPCLKIRYLLFQFAKRIQFLNTRIVTFLSYLFSWSCPLEIQVRRGPK